MDKKQAMAMVEKLIELTQKNVIKWHISDITPSHSGMESISTVYATLYLNQNLRIYKYYYRFYKDEDEYYWIDDYRMELYDDNNNTIYEIPKTGNIKDLLNTVMYYSSGAGDFYNSVMQT